MSAKQHLIDITTSPKVAHTIAAATTGTGAANLFDWIPADIGKFAILIGILGTIITTAVQILRYLRVRKSKKDVNESGSG